MKRLLLVNLHDSPENMLFELALARSVRKKKGVALDVIHDFDFPYGFLGESAPPGGKRLKWSEPDILNRLCRTGGNDIIFLDFPKRARAAAVFIRLAREIPARSRTFVANHLIPIPGQNYTADLVRRLKAFSRMDSLYILAADRLERWEEMGYSGSRAVLREYALDCTYYSPPGLPIGDYVFSAGSAGRDFNALYEGVRLAGLGLKVFSDSKPDNVPAWVDFRPLSKNLHQLKCTAGAARAVAIPLRDDYHNGSAGNSIIFLSMAMGRPVLTRRTGYMEDFIEDGASGFFYERLTPAAIARGLRRIKDLSPAATRKLGTSARRSVLKKASLDRLCSGLLRRLADKPAARGRN